MVAIPRVVIAAPASGHGKTTITTGLITALRLRGRVIQPFKVGPDYIDPGYHSLAAGRAGRNLDPFLCSPELIAPLLVHGFLQPEPAEYALIEGVMGLFDGQLGRQGFASTAHVAKLINSPVILTVDVSHTSRTIAALMQGLANHDPQVRVAGVILNKTATQRHTTEVRQALDEVNIPILGVLPRDIGIEAPSRHLGLVPVAERPDAAQTSTWMPCWPSRTPPKTCRSRAGSRLRTSTHRIWIRSTPTQKPVALTPDLNQLGRWWR